MSLDKIQKIQEPRKNAYRALNSYLVDKKSQVEQKMQQISDYEVQVKQIQLQKRNDSEKLKIDHRVINEKDRIRIKEFALNR